MKKILVLVAIAALFSGAAYANYCARDVVPAATLLVPYIAVGMSGGAPDPAGATTLFAITNVSREAQIVHMTVWDVKSRALIDFDVVLSGYDVWTINWRDFLNGRFDLFDTSRTAFGSTPSREPFEWGPDGRDTVGLTGILTVPEDRNIVPATNCVVPYGDLSTLSATIIDLLSVELYAREHNGCDYDLDTEIESVRPQYATDWLSAIDDSKLFFYATADVVNVCNTAFPNSLTYWQSFGSMENVLIGDVIYLDASNNYSEAMPAVHIEADLQEATANFYLTAADHREPLATAFAFRYADAPTQGVTSSVIMWKNFEDLLEVTGDDPVDDCGYYMYYAWDENEHSLSRSPTGGPSGFQFDDVDPNEFPFETQEVPLSTAGFDVYQFGWMLVVFPPSYDVQPASPATAQAWAAVRFKFGTYSAGMEAATMANAHCFAGQRLPGLGVFWDLVP